MSENLERAFDDFCSFRDVVCSLTGAYWYWPVTDKWNLKMEFLKNYCMKENLSKCALVIHNTL